MGPFQFIGIDDVDVAARIPAPLSRIELSRDHYGVLLYHRPDGFDASAERGIPLMLAGHTHAGQLIPFNFLVKRIYPRIRGLYELNGFAPVRFARHRARGGRSCGSGRVRKSR